MFLDNDLIVLDLESTGTWVERDKIIEIALIKITPSGNKAQYIKRINPQIPIPPYISQLTGIRNEDVENAPTFKEISQEILDFIDDADFAGFNLERFDLPLLQKEFNSIHVSFKWKERSIYDAQKIYHVNEKRDLTAAYKFYCQKELKDAHSALADASATLDILVEQVQKYGDGNSKLAFLQKYQHQKTNEFYDSDKRFRWWNGKLYMMFGKYAYNYSLEEIVMKDPKYLEWVMSANFSQSVKDLVSNALKGRFPEPGETNELNV